MLYCIIPLWQVWQASQHPCYTVQSHYHKSATHFKPVLYCTIPSSQVCHAFQHPYYTVQSHYHKSATHFNTRVILYNPIITSLPRISTPVLHCTIPSSQVCHAFQHSCYTVQPHHHKSVMHFNTRVILHNPIVTSLAGISTPVLYCTIPSSQVCHAFQYSCYTVQPHHHKSAMHFNTRVILHNPIITSLPCISTPMLYCIIPLSQDCHAFYTRVILHNPIVTSLAGISTPVLYCTIPSSQVCHAFQHSCYTT